MHFSPQTGSALRGRGVTEPDVKQELGRVRGAWETGERACGIEPWCGCRHHHHPPPPPHTHTPPPPQSPILSAHPRALLRPAAPLLSVLSIVSITLSSAHTANSTRRPENESAACCVFWAGKKKVTKKCKNDPPPDTHTHTHTHTHRHTQTHTLQSPEFSILRRGQFEVVSKRRQRTYVYVGETAREEGGGVISSRPLFSKCTQSVGSSQPAVS